jgi:hypothetical protein
LGRDVMGGREEWERKGKGEEEEGERYFLI